MMRENFYVDLKSVGERIKTARKKLRKTQEGIAEETELTGQYWSLIENGHCRGSINTYLQIATALGVSLNDLFYDEASGLRFRPPAEYKEFLTGLNEYEKEVLLKLIVSVKEILIHARGML